MKAPLSVVMEDARESMNSAFQNIAERTKLPAFLLEGMLLDLLAEVRSRKAAELLSEMRTMAASKEEKRKEESGEG